MTDRLTVDSINDDQLSRLYDELDRARQELADQAEAESADAAAGSYASGQATLTITITAPNPVHAVRWAGHVRDLVHAEFGASMGLHSFIELEPGGRVEPEGPLTPVEETRLAQSGIGTPGCDCGHDGMGVSWHGDDCPWRSGVLDGATAAPAPAATEATDIETTARVLAALHRSAEDTVTRVIALYEQWVKAGPPPLGVSTARWWDAKLVELHTTLNPPTPAPAAAEATATTRES